MALIWNNIDMYWVNYCQHKISYKENIAVCLRFVIITLLLSFQTISFSQKDLRIGIKLNQPVVYLSSNYPIEVSNIEPKNSVIINKEKSITCAYLREGIAVSETDGKLLFISKSPVTFVPKQPANAVDVPYISYYCDEIKNSRNYRGYIEINHAVQALNVVNIVGVEDYLRGVVSLEMNGSYPLEALKAQAVAARTYAERNRDKMKALNFDMDDTTRFQVYGGLKYEDIIVNKAIDETAGFTLFYKNQLAETVFCSNCGGWTESSLNAWGNNIPYLQSVSDLLYEKKRNSESTTFWNEYCTAFKSSYCLQPKYERAENYRWIKVFTRDELEKILPVEYQVGKISNISILNRGDSGRISSLKISGIDKDITIERENNIRRALGGLKSSAFIIDCYRDDLGIPVVFILRGAGYGHGVGMCQSGAAGRADAGWSFERILKFYFPGTNLQKNR